MNWLSNFIRPRIRSLVGDQKDVPENLWKKCTACEGMLFARDLEKNLNVCYHCGHHMRISVDKRMAGLYDEGKYETLALPKVAHDPLKFKDRKKYVDRLRDSRSKTGREDAIVLAKGKIGGQPVVTAAFDFAFMGGSMGAAVGEAIVKGAQEAVKAKAAFLVVPSSGGARMQEGLISLMQMPRTIIAVEMVKDERLPYIVLLTDPTTGGVSASFAMVGDVHLAEPGSTIGFAGRRVIEETVRETLPDDFQTAEYLQENGIVDMVVERQNLNETIGRIVSILMKKPALAPKGGKGKESSGENSKTKAKKDAGGKASDAASKAQATTKGETKGESRTTEKTKAKKASAG
jgi:acetyl-CoA carboxylase carboxyl transferase subunit beta